MVGCSAGCQQPLVVNIQRVLKGWVGCARRLSRNVLAHMQPWDNKDAQGLSVDVKVIRALPDFLEQPLPAFNDEMVEALALVSGRTVDEAAKQYCAELSEPSDGSGAA
jgi:hypothetical protein